MKSRIINGALWGVIALTLATMVVVEWQKNDVNTFGLVVGAAWFVVACAAVWYVIDETIKEAQE